MYQVGIESGFVVIRFDGEVIAGNAVPSLVRDWIRFDQSRHPERKGARVSGLRTLAVSR